MREHEAHLVQVARIMDAVSAQQTRHAGSERGPTTRAAGVKMDVQRKCAQCCVKSLLLLAGNRFCGPMPLANVVSCGLLRSSCVWGQGIYPTCPAPPLYIPTATNTSVASVPRPPTSCILSARAAVQCTLVAPSRGFYGGFMPHIISMKLRTCVRRPHHVCCACGGPPRAMPAPWNEG